MANDQWELYDGTTIHGPFSESALVQTIERGMPATMKARRVGEEKWLPVGAHEPFAQALARAASAGAGRIPAASPPVIVSQVVNVQPSEGTGCAKGCAFVFMLGVLLFVAGLIARACTS
ncbi:hypothetical protein [Polyangium sorediatum]|uniref:GYF domain-containing protein n=1 Tax=Polyangium sorediatum TaxID=889274 RepID=A0ABT6NMV0_9BACT|nr:hypothetical protein [Polyangium sorediatum]MDI1429616.1 hypothetical protein [Polyangium sorediatum]